MEASKVDQNRPKRKKTGGRKKNVPNKLTANLKEAILEAAKKAGGRGGMVSYLQSQASANPGPFMALLGKVLPMQITGDKDNPAFAIIERRIVDPKG